ETPFERTQHIFNKPTPGCFIRQSVVENIVKTAEKRPIQQCGIVCRSDDQAVRYVLFNKLKESIENPAHFPHIVLQRAFAANRIEFVEEIDAWLITDEVENLPEFGTRFPHEFGHELVHLNGVQ